MSETTEAETETWYAKCTACDWRVEFDRGQYVDRVSLAESAQKRLAGHSGHNTCTSGDHDYGPISEEYAQILEVRAQAALTFHLPLEAGDNPGGAIREALANVSELRHADISVDEIYPTEKY